MPRDSCVRKSSKLAPCHYTERLEVRVSWKQLDEPIRDEHAIAVDHHALARRAGHRVLVVRDEVILHPEGERTQSAVLLEPLGDPGALGTGRPGHVSHQRVEEGLSCLCCGAFHDLAQCVRVADFTWARAHLEDVAVRSLEWQMKCSAKRKGRPRLVPGAPGSSPQQRSSSKRRLDKLAPTAEALLFQRSLKS